MDGGGTGPDGSTRLTSGATRKVAAQSEAPHPGALRVAQVAADHPAPLTAIRDQMAGAELALVLLFVTPQADFRAVVQQAEGQFGEADVLACTTAGELGQLGYEEGQILAVGFPAALFSVRSYAIECLDRLDEQVVIDTAIQQRTALTRTAADQPWEFAFLMIDGLSLCEEHLTTLLAAGLGSMALFGGSSGDGTAFQQTWLARNGVVLENAALVALVRSSCPVHVFSLDHLQPTETRMVVTAADPERRVVQEINAEPAAAEYARLLGKDPNQLDPFIFAAHPVVVRLGDTHHVRAIRQVNEAGELVFFSAINEGMVLTLAEPEDMAQHLDRELSGLVRARGGVPQILACDCVLRRIEAGQSQKTREVSGILRDRNVIGFSTYGEQLGALHVNQTLTGVAIYPPPED
ncbi:MAG: FIST N-terminal domain-containing protein [Rhodobacterales bacterium]|uniref:FIST N-terminal domain-containing protein n=1 Tax=Puniceibacterium antarcticum TaxID=1206336 RepID=UPI001FEBD305|nr:FIST N-terminal domain-containing protein [Puniceibacterium antarcticum]